MGWAGASTPSGADRRERLQAHQADRCSWLLAVGGRLGGVAGLAVGGDGVAGDGLALDGYGCVRIGSACSLPG